MHMRSFNDMCELAKAKDATPGHIAIPSIASSSSDPVLVQPMAVTPNTSVVRKVQLSNFPHQSNNKQNSTNETSTRSVAYFGSRPFDLLKLDQAPLPRCWKDGQRAGILWHTLCILPILFFIYVLCIFCAHQGDKDNWYECNGNNGTNVNLNNTSNYSTLRDSRNCFECLGR